MSSLLTISNKALRRLGKTEILSLTQGVPAAARCDSAVRGCVQEVLREHPWSHAAVWATLPKKSEAPAFGYGNAYQLPRECLRLIDVRQDEDLRAPTIDFEMARKGVVYTDATPCYARYVVYDEDDLPFAPADFIDACAWRLAEEISVPLAKSELMSAMHNGYLLALDRARLNDTATRKEREQDPNRLCTILAAREYPYTEDDSQWP